jgi:putative endonuclease
MEKQGYVYFLTNKINTVIYTGVTSNLKKRVWEHKNLLVEGFTKKYKATKLVYYESCGSIISAIEREKQIKAGSRQKKKDLIASMNPEYKDLYDSI